MMSDPEVIELTLELEPRIVEDIDRLVEELKSSGPAYEFGVRVTREIAGRVAILRGLHGAPVHQTNESTQPARAVENGVGRVEDEGVAEEPVQYELNEEGKIEPPAGWDAWAGELVPQEQMKVHSYYSEQGWTRMHGKLGDETIIFYWSNDPENQEVSAWGGSDMNGRKVVPQTTPFGPGHIVPLGWVEA
jgi:hypothetical protein